MAWNLFEFSISRHFSEESVQISFDIYFFDLVIVQADDTVSFDGQSLVVEGSGSLCLEFGRFDVNINEGGSLTHVDVGGFKLNFGIEFQVTSQFGVVFQQKYLLLRLNTNKRKVFSVAFDYMFDLDASHNGVPAENNLGMLGLHLIGDVQFDFGQLFSALHHGHLVKSIDTLVIVGLQDDVINGGTGDMDLGIYGVFNQGVEGASPSQFSAVIVSKFEVRFHIKSASRGGFDSELTIGLDGSCLDVHLDVGHDWGCLIVGVQIDDVLSVA